MVQAGTDMRVSKSQGEQKSQNAGWSQDKKGKNRPGPEGDLSRLEPKQQKDPKGPQNQKAPKTRH